MIASCRLARGIGASLLVAAAVLGCGQQGPLVLPESARPIERLEEPPPETASEPEDERDDER